MQRLDWMLHTYYEELSRKRREVAIANPTGRMIEDGGADLGEFKSKIPPGVYYTDPGIIEVSQQVKLALLNLECHNERWYLAVAATYQRRPDGSTRTPGQCCQMLSLAPRTYRKHRAKGKWWIKDYIGV